MTTPSLQELRSIFDRAGFLEDLFTGHNYRLHDEKDWLAACHPDRHLGSYDEASKLFKDVNSAFECVKVLTTIKSPKREYRLGFRAAEGDVADVWWAANRKENARYLVKISRVPNSHKMLDRERDVLEKMYAVAVDMAYRLYYPRLVESFPAHDRIQRRVNVIAAVPDQEFTLTRVTEKYPEGIDSKHVAWIFKRLLTAIGFANRLGIVHGAILPQHVLVTPRNHGLKLIGWGQSVDLETPLKIIVNNFRGWYPPEVLDKRPAGPETDIYMAAKCMLHISDGTSIGSSLPSGSNLPDALSRFFHSLLLPGRLMRPEDAFVLYEEFDTLLRSLYGPPKFVDLTM